jgi:hypothetical protein
MTKKQSHVIQPKPTMSAITTPIPVTKSDVALAKITLKTRIANIKEQLKSLPPKQRKAAMDANNKEDTRLYHENIYEGVDEVAHYKNYQRHLANIITNPNPTLELGECMHLLGQLNAAGTFDPKNPNETTVVIVHALMANPK